MKPKFVKKGGRTNPGFHNKEAMILVLVQFLQINFSCFDIIILNFTFRI